MFYSHAILVHLHVGKTYFRMTGFALGLALKQRRQATWKPPTPPRFFAPSLAHRTFHLMALSLFYCVARGSSHNHLRPPSPAPPTLQPHSPLTQSQYLQHNTVLSLHHRTSSLSLPFRTNLPFPTSTALGSQYP